MINKNYTIETIKTLEEIKEIKEDWQKLFHLKKDSPILFSFEVFKIYYETIITNFHNVKIEIFIIKNKDQKTVAIFPFTFEIKRYFSALSWREFSVKDEFLIRIYNFLIDPEEKPEIIFQEFLAYIKEKKRKWDIIKIYSLADDEKLIKIFTSIIGKYYKIIENVTNTLVIDCQREFEEYVKNDMDGKELREMKRKCRRLDEKGTITLLEMREPQEIEKGLPYFYEIEDSGWKGTGGTSLKRSYYGEFYQKMASHLAKEDKFRLYFLQINDEYIAGIYAIIDRDILYLIKIGYTDAFSKYSPSNVLFYRVFEKLFSEKKIKKIDFHAPYQPFEKIFGTQTRKKYNITICNRKVLPTIYYIFLKVLKKFGYPFTEDSLKGKIFSTITKHFYSGYNR